jgi:polysaccharide export outer membrane protein
MVAEINRSLTAAALQTAAPTDDYRIGPEDILQITLFNIPAGEQGVTPRTTDVRVSQDGMITLPLLGDVPVAGLTTSVVEQSLRERYDKYLRNPEVGVYVREFKSQRVSVLGAVRSPGVFQLTGPQTLIDLLAMAGGVSEKAGMQVHVYRQAPEGRQSYVVDLLALARNPGSVNMSVEPGDVINIPQAGTFFVDGKVGKPGSYPMDQSYTHTRALAIAGGADVTLAKLSSISIFRRRDDLEPERIEVDLNDVLAGKATDPLIEPDDVIIVPMSTAKYIVERYIGAIGLGGVPMPPIR